MSRPHTHLFPSFLTLAVFTACAAAPAFPSGQPVSILPPFPPAAHIIPGGQTRSPQTLPDRILLPVTFTDTGDRVYWDIPLPIRLPARSTSLEIDLACTNPAPVRGLSLHLQSGDGWHAFPTPLSAFSTRRRLCLPRGLFTPEGNPGAWHKSRSLRLSAWKNTPGTTAIALFGLSARSDTIAIVRATDLTAPGETAFAASLADRCARLLAKADIPFAVTGDTLDDLGPYTLLLLPYAPTLPERQFARLERFVKHGGKLILFYNASQPLGALLGVRPGAWQGTDPGLDWSSLIPRLPDAAARVPHLTNNLLPPFPAAEHHARTVAVWTDATGRATDLPACVLTDRCAWFAHVPPLAYPSAAALLQALVKSLSPSSQPVTITPQPVTCNLKPVTSPLPGSEIRGVWESSGYARHPQGWDGLLKTLSAHGINTLFAHWQSAGTAHYRTGGKLAESDRPRAGRSDPLADALTAGRKHKVAIHAWVTCWTLEGAAPAQRAALTSEGRLMRDAAGNVLPWLCPSIPANRALIINGLRDLAQRGVDGIHLDYARYPEETGCYAPATRKAFESRLGAPVAAWPSAVLSGGPHAAAFQKFRRDTLTAFVREARDAVRAINPAVRFSAAVFPSPA
ncbi:MAG: family 10 glycosylhydrolase, partial [Kiritimatiellae bacterium]|nr:family 10 glycosylhydrolase [Kiritimatiellia bacterium]